MKNELKDLTTDLLLRHGLVYQWRMNWKWFHNVCWANMYICVSMKNELKAPHIWQYFSLGCFLYQWRMNWKYHWRTRYDARRLLVSMKNELKVTLGLGSLITYSTRINEEWIEREVQPPEDLRTDPFVSMKNELKDEVSSNESPNYTIAYQWRMNWKHYYYLFYYILITHCINEEWIERP